MGCIGLSALLLSGCQESQFAAQSVDAVPPTAISTLEPAFTLEPELSAATVQLTSPPKVILTQPTSQNPDPQPTTTAGISRQALVQIDSPGPGSKVRDFVWVRANVYPGDKGNVNLLLTGEDGRTVASRELTYSTWTTGWLSIAEQLEFSPAAASEKALLSVYTRDGYGRIVSLASVPVLMLQVGPEEIELPGFHGDPFVVAYPLPGSAAQNGTLHIEGFSHLSRSGKGRVELIQSDGSVLATQEVSFAPVVSGDGYSAFTTDLAYQVGQRMPVRLTFRQVSSEYGLATTELSSAIIYLDP